MNISRKTLLAFALGVGLTLGGNALVTGAFANQPYMIATLEQLRAARASLQAAEPNKGGHREVALGLIDQAIEQVQAGIAFAAGR
ncbi:hypothetical protein [Aquabacter cavernae]|uniref:hypothetical protein n=1 Tax=Aquabacter cavernae TaxID=2496029 RepID=UPI000F8ECEF9|nr:hypothetical protein [Aquabacter cavernae]